MIVALSRPDRRATVLCLEMFEEQSRHFHLREQAHHSILVAMDRIAKKIADDARRHQKLIEMAGGHTALMKAAQGALTAKEAYDKIGLGQLSRLQQVAMGKEFSATSKFAEGVMNASKGLDLTALDSVDMLGLSSVGSNLAALPNLMTAIVAARDAALGSPSPAYEAAMSVHRVMAQAQDVMRVNGILESIYNTQRYLDEFSRKHRDTILGVHRSLERAIAGFIPAFQAIESFGQGLARHQELISQQIHQLSLPQSRDLLQAFANFEFEDWEETKEPVDVESAPEEWVQARLVAIFMHIVSRLNPVAWGPGEYMAILFYILAIYGPAFTAEDRGVLDQAATDTKIAQQQASLANDALEELRKADATQRAYEQHVAELPRAIVCARANVRDEPLGSAKRIALLSESSPVAIMEKKGRWLKIVYRDDLIQGLREGWVWGNSVAPLGTQ